MSVSEAAEALDVSPRRVRQLLASGRVPGRQLGRSWAIERAELDRFHRNKVGRPWNASSAWAALILAGGGEPDVSAVDRSRARRRLSEHGLADLIGQLRARADRLEMYAHPSALGPIMSEPGVVRSGVSAAGDHGADLIAVGVGEIYVRASNVSDLVDRYALDDGAERPNLIVRVVHDEVWPFDDDAEVAPWPVVAVDLLDADDDRSRRAGLELIARHQ